MSLLFPFINFSLFLQAIYVEAWQKLFNQLLVYFISKEPLPFNITNSIGPKISKVVLGQDSWKYSLMCMNFLLSFLSIVFQSFKLKYNGCLHFPFRVAPLYYTFLWFSFVLVPPPNGAQAVCSSLWRVLLPGVLTFLQSTMSSRKGHSTKVRLHSQNRRVSCPKSGFNFVIW